MAELSKLDQHALAAGRAFPWHELYVPDVDAALSFYQSVLGMTTQDFSMGEGGGVYKMLCANGTPVAGTMSTRDPNLPPDVPPHWAVYFAVEDVDACVERAVASGGALLAGPMDVPTVGRMALITDNQGAHLWLYAAALSE
ncbi:MAG: VOC family protein [Armatimonadota bacterium]